MRFTFALAAALAIVLAQAMAAPTPEADPYGPCLVLHPANG